MRLFVGIRKEMSMRSDSRVVVIAFSLCSVAGNIALAQAPRPMTLVDILNMPQISDPQLSPDGRRILFVESKADWKLNRRVGDIWRINADGSELTQMTTGGASSPHWSPDGKSIAFIARRGAEDGVSQVFLISTSGGEARPLTMHATAVSNFSWSPDGSIIYFLASNPKSEEEKAREKSKDDVLHA